MGSGRSERTLAKKWRPAQKGVDGVDRNFESVADYIAQLEARVRALECMQPQFDAAVESDSWSLPGVTFASDDGSSTPAAESIHYTVPFFISDPNLTITDACFYVVTAESGKIARVGLYGCDVDGQPTTLVSDFGSVSVATTGTKTYSAGLSVKPGVGVYMLALYTDGSSGEFRWWNAASRAVADITAGTNNYLRRTYAANATDYTGGLPSTAEAIDTVVNGNTAETACLALLRWTTSTPAT